MLAIEPSIVRSDFEELIEALNDLRIQEACLLLATIGNKPLLDQMDFGDQFRAWLKIQRKHVEGQLQIAVSRALVALDRDGDMDGHAQLSEAWLACGRADARHWDGKIRIAVLPFEQRDAVGGPFFLAEGVVEELVSRLSGVSALAVVARASVASVANSGRTIPALASALNVSHLVEGSVDRFPDSIRITLRLLDGPTGVQIWSHRYDGTLDGAMKSRPHIGANIIAGLCKAIGVEAHTRAARTMTASREAYSLYLQGRALTYRAIGDGVLDKAIELLEQALELDPDFAECWTALAEAHVNTIVFTPQLDRVERSQRMAECAARAIELDSRQGHAHSMRGIHEWTLGNPLGALDHAYEAYRLEPNNADVTARLGSFLLYIGHTQAALPYVEEAIEQDPVYGRNFAMLCAAHFNLGDYNAALDAGQRMIDLGMPGMWLAVIEAALGDNEKAVETYYRQRLLMNSVILPPAGLAPMDDDARDGYWTIASRGICSGKEDDRAIYCQILDGLHLAMPDPCDASIALPAIWMGHTELVMKLYRKQIHPANMLGLMSLWTDVDPIRQTRLHPSFLSFADDIGLVAAWEKYGWPDLLPRSSHID
jgi:TolB-like protein